MQDNIFRSTMFNGLFMGILFAVNFLFSSSKNFTLLMLSYLIIALIIVVMYRMTKRYRDFECEGYIKYWRVFSYVVLTFFFAGIISSIFKIIYTKYINPEYLSSLFEESMRQIEQNRVLFERLNLPLDDNYFTELERQMRPVNYSIQTIWMNVLLGAILGLILGGFIKKQKSIFEEDTPIEKEN
ncbi:MAG: DUF4199 domain-containing protein [Paludibacter sp.]|nr:DUF4199 domain-containing protein [Paludibacter sp.]MDD4199501.1 DUF4199 domain-containing protein [Paludibacter sp.]MDD4428711.1 DUF4199 domain-containing protein [Paludibacter sp.]